MALIFARALRILNTCVIFIAALEWDFGHQFQVITFQNDATITVDAIESGDVFVSGEPVESNIYQWEWFLRG